MENKFVEMDISSELLKHFGKQKPIVVCLGSSKVLSDMVGVFVADILRSRKVDTIVFGGNNRNVDKGVAKYLSKYLDETRLLFVDSGMFADKSQKVCDTKIAFLEHLILNDQTVINSPSIIANTITLKNQKPNFASVSYLRVKKIATKIADCICEYFSYVDLLQQSKTYS